MTVEGESIHKTVRTRLQFTPSPELNESMKEFLRHDVRNKMAQRAVWLSLFSTQSVELGLGHGAEVSEEDFVADDKYEELIARSRNHMFHLAPYVGYEEHDGGIALQFQISFQNHERAQLIQPPVFPRDYSDEVRLYTLLPRDRLLGRQGLNVAFSKLRRQLGATENNGAKIAPWSIYATNSRVFHRWPYPNIDRKTDDDPLSRYLDNA
jgi:hypothetical protein